MLKKRLIAAILVRDNLVVQSIGFKQYLPVGKLQIAVDYLQSWDIDEIVILDINASRQNRTIDAEMIREVSRKCFIPISIGGGIKNIEDIHSILSAGADKVVLNSILYSNPALIAEAREIFGSQSIIASVDIKETSPGHYGLYSHSGTRQIDIPLFHWISILEEMGAGELLVNSIDRDGSKRGYDIPLIASIEKATTMPLIAMGGAGKNQDFIDLFQRTGIHAAAAGNLFHFTEHSPVTAKAMLHQQGVDVRIRHETNYLQADFYDSRLTFNPEQP